MTYKEVINYFGSAPKIAKRLRLTRQAIYYWRDTGKIPMNHQAVMEKISKGKLKMDEFD